MDGGTALGLPTREAAHTTAAASRLRGGETTGRGARFARRDAATQHTQHTQGARGRRRVDLEVVVPAYNEEGRIGETLRALVAFLDGQPWSSAVIVVDNGSIDRTAELVDRLGPARTAVHVIGCADQGKGAAVRRGVLTSRARWVGFADADLATPVDTLARVVPLLEAGHPVVIGSRRCPGAEYLTPQPLTRRVGSRLFRRLAGAITTGIADTQCGFKFFHADVARALFTRAGNDGFAFDVELVALAQLAGLSVTEVPVAWSDAAGSTVSFADGLRAMREVHAMRGALAARRREGVLAELELQLAGTPDTLVAAGRPAPVLEAA